MVPSRDTTDLAAAFRQNPHITAILADLSALALPDPCLVAGCLAQTIWNLQAGRDPTAGIADYDLAYFDPIDLSAETESAHEARLRARFGLKLDVKNQARVHLWYEAKFGRAIAPYPSIAAAIATYPTTATSIGYARDIIAPFGTTDLQAGIVRPNTTLASQQVYEAKSARWACEWPHLQILPWIG